MTMQPKLDVPLAIQAGLASGKYIRRGGVIRYASTGRIHSFLKDAADSDASRAATARAAALMKSRGAVAGAALGLLALGATAVTVARRRREPAEPAVPSYVATTLNDSLRTYLDAARAGNLDASIVGQLIADLDELQEHVGTAGAPFGFSTELWDAVVQLVVDHTQRLAQDFSVDLSEFEAAGTASASDSVVDLRSHLEAQRSILSTAA